MKKISCTLGLLLTLCFSPTRALPLMDIRVDDLLLQAQDMKKSLNLNPNQILLWQQLEPKLKSLQRARHSRRDKLQIELQQALDDPKTELRELAPRLDGEENTSLAENRQMREWLLSLNDALDDNQRQTLLKFLSDQLQRAPFGDKEGRPMRGPGEKGGENHGRGRQKPGGMGPGGMGPGGMGPGG